MLNSANARLDKDIKSQYTQGQKVRGRLAYEWLLGVAMHFYVRLLGGVRGAAIGPYYNYVGRLA